jgi:beta-lactamase superfamily II metal-dependent hydrolase
MQTGSSEGEEMFLIEMLPAYHGNCLWIEWGDKLNPHHLLVDGGLAGTYNAILDRAGGKCSLELFCVTHVDQDHVEGAVKLLANLPRDLNIREVWFNGWDQLTDAPRLGAVQGEKLGAAIASQPQIKWNGSFNGKAVMIPDQGELPQREFAGLTLTVLSPGKAELMILKPVWEKECIKAGLKPGDIEQATAALEADRRLRPKRLGAAVDVEALNSEAYVGDASPANGSSIALLAEFERKAVLLGADAHSEVLEKGVLRLLAQRGRKKLKIDACQVLHHGSKFNNSPALVNLLDCTRWLFSTNGDKFEHPDRETIARILVSRGSDETKLYFNYRSECNDCWDSAGLRRTWHYDAIYPASGKTGIAVEL